MSKSEYLENSNFRKFVPGMFEGITEAEALAQVGKAYKPSPGLVAAMEAKVAQIIAQIKENERKDRQADAARQRTGSKGGRMGRGSNRRRP